MLPRRRWAALQSVRQGIVPWRAHAKRANTNKELHGS
jgi:hypothetical protein